MYGIYQHEDQGVFQVKSECDSQVVKGINKVYSIKYKIEILYCVSRECNRGL